MSRATIVIVARNAQDTICRAVRSAIEQRDCPIVLVDDFSTDKTVSRAIDTAGRRLHVVLPFRHDTLGVARQTGLEAVGTPYGVWLDSDDELLPGRVERLVEAMERDHTALAADSVELYDGPTGSQKGQILIPSFLRRDTTLVRLFERNYLPGLGAIGFRVEEARKIGYDPTLHGAEDLDFVLRAIAGGLMGSLLEEIGYRLYAYPGSLSRQLDNQRRMCRRCLLKHDYARIRSLYSLAGHSPRVAAWALVSMAIFREEFDAAWGFVAEVESLTDDRNEVLENGGPCPFPEGWRISFHRGTVLLLQGRTAEAIPHLRDAEAAQPTPEGANNLGVAYARSGYQAMAMDLFRVAKERFPSYTDPEINIRSSYSPQVTRLPLRRHSNRDDYNVE